MEIPQLPHVARIFLGGKAHGLAERFSDSQQTIDRIKRVYLNTLAVYAVETYLQSLGIATNWPDSQSYQTVTQTLMDVADLSLPALGTLECRPIFGEEEVMQVPPEVWSDRIGYLAVQLNDDLNEAALLGFVPTVDSPSIPLNQLQSLDALLEYIDQLEAPLRHQAAPTPKDSSLQPVGARFNPSPMVQLHRWLDHVVEAGWQMAENAIAELSAPTGEMAFAFRQLAQPQELQIAESVSQTRLLQFPEHPDIDRARLLVGIRPQASDDYEVLVGLYPREEPYLVPGIKLILLDDSGETILQAQSRSKNESLHFTFAVSSGDQFSVKILYEEVGIEQTFMI